MTPPALWILALDFVEGVLWRPFMVLSSVFVRSACWQHFGSTLWLAQLRVAGVHVFLGFVYVHCLFVMIEGPPFVWRHQRTTLFFLWSSCDHLDFATFWSGHKHPGADNIEGRGA